MILRKLFLLLAGPLLALGMHTGGAAASSDNELVVATMRESLPLSMKPRRSRFFNESEILDTLIKLDYDMKLVPGLATGWERLSLTEWAFTLRAGVTFHDGSPLDAAAVKFSLERVIALLPFAADLLNVAEIAAPEPLLLRIRTNEPFAALPNQLTDAITVIYARSAFDAAGNFVKPVGTGPWKFVEYRKQSHTTVERFDGYWGDTPALEKIVYRYIPDHNARTIALETGEIDVAVNIPPADVARLSKEDGFAVYREPSAGLYYGAFNVAQGQPLGDARVRRAVNLLVDRKPIVDAALDGVGRPAWQFFPDGYSWVPDGVPAFHFDPAGAAALLEDAGYTKAGGRWMRDGKPLTMRILSYSSRTEMPAITEAMAALLQAQGIATEVGMYTWPGMLDLVKKGEYDISVVFWTPEMIGHPDLHLKSQFHSKAPLNFQNWSNPEFDRLVDTGRGLDPGTERQNTYRRALTILQTDAPIIPLVHKIYVAASSDHVKGFRVHPSGFFYDFKSVKKVP